VVDGAGCVVTDGAGCAVTGGAGCDVIDGAGCAVIDGEGGAVTGGAGCDVTDGAGCAVAGGAGCDVVDGAGRAVTEGAGGAVTGGAGCRVTDGPSRQTAAATIAITPKIVALPEIIRHDTVLPTAASLGCSSRAAELVMCGGTTSTLIGHCNLIRRLGSGQFFSTWWAENQKSR
jgi:hypothetical protein